MKKKKGLLVVISGPSGVGKDTLFAEFQKDTDAHLSVSATSRKPRKGEVDGEHYYFLTKEEFEEKINQGDFLEYAKYNDNYYGTPKSKIEETLNEGKNVFLIIEVQGALQIKKMLKESILIFILPPNFEVLENRLRNRKTDSEEMIENRLKIAKEELKMSDKYDYRIVNDDLNKAKEELEKIIEKEENKR